MCNINLNEDISDSPGPRDPKDERKRQVLIKRLISQITILLKENPVLPMEFKFNGVDLLEKLKLERQDYKESNREVVSNSRLDTRIALKKKMTPTFERVEEESSPEKMQFIKHDSMKLKEVPAVPTIQLP